MASGQRRPRSRVEHRSWNAVSGLTFRTAHNLRAEPADYWPRRYKEPPDAAELSAISEPDLSEPCYGTDHQTVGPGDTNGTARSIQPQPCRRAARCRDAGAGESGARHRACPGTASRAPAEREP